MSSYLLSIDLSGSVSLNPSFTEGDITCILPSQSEAVYFYRFHIISLCLLILSPCIMCVQYRGGCSVPWGVFSTVGDIMSTVGDILSTVGVFSTVGDILNTVGVFSTVGGYHECRGGYLEYLGGCSVPWGIS